MPDEQELVSGIKKLAATQQRQPRVLKGIGDDCAIIRPKPGRDLVFTTDFVLEGRHFTLDTHKAAEIGHKALARSLSDLAAMGSKPLFCLVSLAVPTKLSKSFIPGFYKGLLALARKYKIALAGGDLASFDQVVADVLCCGEVPAGKSLLRGNAVPGDSIYVSGELGGAANGLRTGKGRNFRRHLLPEPRIFLGRILLDLGVRCCMDVSDGLAMDLHRLCKESKVGADLSGELPGAEGATESEILTGGEDYELLFTAPSKIRIPTVIDGVRITKIGVVSERGRVGIRLSGKGLKVKGFDHFHP